MSEPNQNLSASPTGFNTDRIEEVKGVAHVRIEGEITFAAIDDEGENQPVWSWSKQSVVPVGDQEVGAFWQVLRFFVEERGRTKEEMLDWLEATADSLRREIQSEDGSE